MAVREIRGLNQGETCTFNIKATCGAPGFTTAPGGDWSSQVDNFNITYVEFEVESQDDYQTRIQKSQYLDGEDLNKNFIEGNLLRSRFIFPMHDMEDILHIEATTRQDT